MDTKICSKKDCMFVGQSQPLNNFHKAGRFYIRTICKFCVKIYDHRRRSNLEYKEKDRKQHATDKAKKQDKERKRTEKYKVKIRLRENKKRQEDLEFKIKKNLRVRLYDALKNNFKSGSAVADLGCSIDDFKVWLEQQFYMHPKTGEQMNWLNYGKRWNIDHIIPLSLVRLTDRKQLVKVCNWFNLRPLWAEQNFSRGNRI